MMEVGRWMLEVYIWIITKVLLKEIDGFESLSLTSINQILLTIFNDKS